MFVRLFNFLETLPVVGTHLYIILLAISCEEKESQCFHAWHVFNSAISEPHLTLTATFLKGFLNLVNF